MTTYLGGRRGDPNTIRVFDDVFTKRAAKTKHVVRTRANTNLKETRRILADCTDVIVWIHNELLQEQSCVRQLARQEQERRRAIEALLSDAAHRLPVLTIRCEHDAGSKVHSKKGSSSCQSRKHRTNEKSPPQLSDHREDRAIRIGRLAHEVVGRIDAADDNDVQTEDLDVHDIT